MSAVGLAATTSIAGIFGMNLVSGIEEAPLAFASVTAGSGLVGAAVIACVEIKTSRRFRRRLNHDLHAIDATPARWRGGAGSSPLDGGQHGRVIAEK